MIKHARKIESKKNKGKVKPTFFKRNAKVGDWDFNGHMPTGEPIWYNAIDDYTLMMHIN